MAELPSEAGPAPAIATTVEAAPLRELSFGFRGSGGEYFRIWIVNLLLTILTLGIYSAWAKVRRLRYFYGNTVLDGSAFEYHGRPSAILKGRLIAFGTYLAFVIAAELQPALGLVGLPLIVFGLPWIIQRGRLFQMRMSSFRNIRFNFHGTYGGAMKAFVGWMALALVTLYTLFPAALWHVTSYSLGQSAYGAQRAAFVTPGRTFFKFVYAAMGLLLLLGITVVILVGAGAATAAVPAGAAAGGTGEAGPAFDPARAGWLWPVLAAGVAGVVAIVGYYQSRFVNASFGGLEIGAARLHSRLKARRLIWIYLTNLLGVVATLGLYYPWAKIRQMRYQIESLSVTVPGGLDQFTASVGEATDAIGEEVGDFFDVDFGV